jgi:hypothetical protein
MPNSGVQEILYATGNRAPIPVSIAYGVGSLTQTLQQNALNLMNDNGEGDNPNLYNVTW